MGRSQAAVAFLAWIELMRVIHAGRELQEEAAAARSAGATPAETHGAARAPRRRGIVPPPR